MSSSPRSSSSRPPICPFQILFVVVVVVVVIVVVNFLVQLFKWRPIVLLDNYIEHASADEQLNLPGLFGHQIAATAYIKSAWPQS
jgi:hypothetical protein